MRSLRIRKRKFTWH